MTSSLKLLLQQPVAIPFDQWLLELTVEENRPLSPLEEAVLSLSQAGVRELDRFAELLGIDHRLLASGVSSLRLKNALTANQGQYSISETGAKLLEQNAHRTLRRVTAKVLHDPFRDEFSWPQEEHEEEVDGLRRLPAPPELRKAVMTQRYSELHRLLGDDGLPDEQVTPLNEQLAERAIIVNVHPRNVTRIYRTRTLQVWLDPATTAIRFQLLQDDHPDEQTTDVLNSMWYQGTEIVPLQAVAPSQDEAQRIMDRLSSLHTNAQAISAEQGGRVRDLTCRAIEQATDVVLILESFHEEDGEVLRKLRQRLLKDVALKAVVLLSSSPEGQQADASARTTLSQLQQLPQLSGRLVWMEVPQLHAHGVFKDDEWAVIATREFMRHPTRTAYGFSYSRQSFNALRTTVTTVRTEIIQLLRELPSAPANQ